MNHQNLKFLIIPTFFIYFIMFSCNSSAYPAIKAYGNVNLTQYKAYLAIIPIEYYYDLHYIKVFETQPAGILGYYWINNGIDIFGDSGYETLVHELAHHCQIKKGDGLYLALQHAGHFLACEQEIMSYERINST